jgi:hypothetical protein
MIWRDALEPVNARVLGPLDAAEMTPLPSVFLLGNHSSGQSTFINYVMGRDVQSVGVAPTDDSFSIICSGPQDMDQDGHAVIMPHRSAEEGLPGARGVSLRGGSTAAPASSASRASISRAWRWRTGRCARCCGS